MSLAIGRQFQLVVCTRQALGVSSLCSLDQGPISRMIFPAIDNSFYSHLSCTKVITMQYCTGHVSCVVVVCVKLCYNIIPYFALKSTSHQIWITVDELFKKWTPNFLLAAFYVFVVDAAGYCYKVTHFLHNPLSSMPPAHPLKWGIGYHLYNFIQRWITIITFISGHK